MASTQGEISLLLKLVIARLFYSAEHILSPQFSMLILSEHGDFATTMATVFPYTEACAVSFDANSFNGIQLVLMLIFPREIFVSHCLECR